MNGTTGHLTAGIADKRASTPEHFLATSFETLLETIESRATAICTCASRLLDEVDCYQPVQSSRPGQPIARLLQPRLEDTRDW